MVRGRLKPLVRCFSALISALALVLTGGADARTSAMPSPVAKGGAVELVASGLHTTTAFAFGVGQVFAAEEPSGEQGPGGGVYVLSGGHGRVVYRGASFGLAWHDNALYVSAVYNLVRLSGWNGRSFAHTTVLYSGSGAFTGFTGIGFGADGRLYAGVYLGANDHSPSSAPYAFDVLSFDAGGGDRRIVARGLRQPWQLAFAPGSSSPYVSVLGQDMPEGIEVPDFIVHVSGGRSYGFPACNWAASSPCGGYARPVRFFAPHTDVGGLAIAGRTLYASEFGFASALHPPRVVAMPLARRGSVQTVLSGFTQPIVGLAADRGWLYVGDVAGRIYRAHL
jgi:glucose/arabinose dehydrogenase